MHEMFQGMIETKDCVQLCSVKFFKQQLLCFCSHGKEMKPLTSSK